MRELGPEDAYALTIERDDLPTYVEYVQTYPRSPYARRIWAQIRARREALAWMRAVQRNTPEAYWTYLRRYPNGVYAFDARRRLRHLFAREEPPSGFAPVEFSDVPPPLADEPTDDYASYDPGPPPPRLIDPPPTFFVNLPPPQRHRGPRFLPLPVPMPVSPRFGAPPPRFGAPVGIIAPNGPLPGVKPGGRGAIVTPTPPGQTGPKFGTVPGVKPPGAVTTVSPPGTPVPNLRRQHEGRPPGVVTTTPPGGPPPKPPTFGPKPAPTFAAPASPPPPKPPTPPGIKPPGQPTVVTQGVKPGPGVKPPPAPTQTTPRRRCPIVNGVENCNIR